MNYDDLPALKYEADILDFLSLYSDLPVGVELNLIPFEDAYERLREKAVAEGELM